jgi:transferase CAF17, mitochondrial
MLGLGTRLAKQIIRSSIHKRECAQILDRSLISITGANATQFLDGLLSNRLPPAGGIYSALLHAQVCISSTYMSSSLSSVKGRVLYDLFVYSLKNDTPKESGYLIEHDSRSSAAPPLLDILKRYILRSKVKIRDVSSEWSVWVAWGNTSLDAGPERCWHWTPSQAVESNWKSTRSPWATGCPLRIHDRRVDGMGLRELVRQGEKRE